MTSANDSALGYMEKQLRALGYDDLRFDCPLVDIQEIAALAAFDGDDPVVVCYPPWRMVASKTLPYKWRRKHKPI